MKNILLLSILLLLISCKNKSNPLSIEIVNNKLISYSIDSKKDTLNIIKFKIVNSSNYIYYINKFIQDRKLKFKSVYKNGNQLRIFDGNKEVIYKNLQIPHNLNYQESIYYSKKDKIIFEEAIRLGYNEMKEYFYSKDGIQNFFIHPNETLYFEYYINISDTISDENFRGGFADLKKGVNYYAKLSIASDSTNYKNDLPRDVLKTIEANHVKVYHGIIESNNKVPVKVLE